MVGGGVMSDHRYVCLVMISERFLYNVVTSRQVMFHRLDEPTISSYQMINSL